MPTARKSPVAVLESTRPAEDPAGAGAEREWGFDPQPKAELAHGEYKEERRSKGSTGTTRTHAHTARPWGVGWPGGCARLMTSGDLMALANVGAGVVQRAPHTPGDLELRRGPCPSPIAHRGAPAHQPRARVRQETSGPVGPDTGGRQQTSDRPHGRG
jgi:hypothetical protein